MSDAKPISQRKLKANRRNASRSTGPKTPEGKSIARWNAWKHGLHSQKLLLPGEKESDWLAFREQLSDGLKPVGELELLLADRITMLAWRIRRLSGLESGVFVWNYYKIIADRNWAGYTLRDFPETQELHEKESVPEKEAVSKYREAEAQRIPLYIGSRLYPRKRAGRQLCQALPLRGQAGAEFLQCTARVPPPPGSSGRRPRKRTCRRGRLEIRSYYPEAGVSYQ